MNYICSIFFFSKYLAISSVTHPISVDIDKLMWVILLNKTSTRKVMHLKCELWKFSWCRYSSAAWSYSKLASECPRLQFFWPGAQGCHAYGSGLLCSPKSEISRACTTRDYTCYKWQLYNPLSDFFPQNSSRHKAYLSLCLENIFSSELWQFLISVSVVSMQRTTVNHLLCCCDVLHLSCKYNARIIMWIVNIPMLSTEVNGNLACRMRGLSVWVQ